MVPTDLSQVKQQVAVFDLAEKEAYENGVKTADSEIETGVVNYKCVPMRGGYKGMMLLREAADKFGMTVQIVGGGTPLSGLERPCQKGQQETVEAFLKKKYGVDPVIKLSRPWEIQKK